MPVALITVLGLVLRLLSALVQPVALDEAYAVFETRFYHFPFTSTSPPLFPLLFRIWTHISVNLFWIRLPSVIAGTLTIIIVWLLMRTVDRKTADISAFLAAVSPILVHYSWFARIYGVEILCIALSLLLFLQAIRGKHVVLLTAVNIVGCFISYGFILYLPAVFFSILVWRFSTIKRLILPFVLPAAAIAGLLIYALQHAAAIQAANSWIPPFSLPNFAGMLAVLTNMSGVVTGTPIPLPYALLFLAGMIGYIVLTVRISPKSLSFFRFLLPVGFVLILIASATTPSGIPRTFLFFHLFFLLSFSSILVSLIKKSRFLSITLLTLYLAAIIPVYRAINIRPYYNNPSTLIAIAKAGIRPVYTIVTPKSNLPIVAYEWNLKNITLLHDTTDRPPQKFTLFHIATTRLSAGAHQLMANKNCNVEHAPGIVIYYCQ